MRRGRKGQATPSVEAKSGSAEGQERSSNPLRQGEKRQCGGAGKAGQPPPSRRKTAMRRGRKVQATPSVKAKNGDAEGQKSAGEPLRQGEKRQCGGAGKCRQPPPSRRKAAMRRGRKGRAPPSVKAENRGVWLRACVGVFMLLQGYVFMKAVMSAIKNTRRSVRNTWN